MKLVLGCFSHLFYHLYVNENRNGSHPHCWCVLFPALLATMEFEEQTVKIGEGESFTFHTSELMHEDIFWLYGHLNPHTLIAQIYRSDINTEFSERFRDRLQLNMQTGSLTIRNASAKDSGIYRAEVTGARATQVKIFHFAVYGVSSFFYSSTI